MRLAGFLETSLCDWEGKVSSVVFTQGCNFSCPYCHNPGLVPAAGPEAATDAEEIGGRLRAIRGWIDGVVVTGGEPTLQGGLDRWLGGLKRAGHRVKLDTNGSRPRILERLLDAGLVDAVAMDVKSAPTAERYREACGREVDFGAVRASAEMLREAGVEVEFRTTAVPGLADGEDIRAIAEWLGASARYIIQQFRPGGCLDGRFDRVSPFPDEQLSKMRAIASDLVAECRVRGEKLSGGRE
ncbi:MAG TPA: anaerobic ribonucleoside-triphosphate reductase activating protein [bacterium]|nr:anaerobic ribonucleoside-triphosphate reductase activating protein [bacterium]